MTRHSSRHWELEELLQSKKITHLFIGSYWRNAIDFLLLLFLKQQRPTILRGLYFSLAALNEQVAYEHYLFINCQMISGKIANITKEEGEWWALLLLGVEEEISRHSWKGERKRHFAIAYSPMTEYQRQYMLWNQYCNENESTWSSNEAQSKG